MSPIPNVPRVRPHVLVPSHRRQALLLAAAAVAPWMALPTLAGLTSANYQIEPTAFSGGASLSSSANYSSFSGISGTVVGTSTSSSYTAHYGFFPSAGPVDVTGRFAFYNRSAWDGNNAAANANDDNAIATDKQALRSGTATFANYTSYSRGLNGIMVDLPNGAAPTAADFSFKRGNNNTPAGWAAAPNPSSITVRAGAGVGGADRVTLIWPDNTIQKQWLQVTVLSTANTGLSLPDTFYFGNAIGETGDTAANALVGAADESAIRAHPRGPASPAPITYAFDITRDKLVGAADVSAMRFNATGPATALRLIQIGAGDPAPIGGDAATVPSYLSASPDDASAASHRLSLRPEGLGSGRILIGSFRASGVSAEQVRIQACSQIGESWHDVTPQPEIAQDGDTFVFQFPAAQGGVNQFFRVLFSNE